MYYAELLEKIHIEL